MLANRCFRSLLMATALAAPVVVTGCAVRARVYDPYRSDYHHWDAHETVYYNRWADENHHDHDYKKLKPEEQRDYWKWRHDQH